MPSKFRLAPFSPKLIPSVVEDVFPTLSLTTKSQNQSIYDGSWKQGKGDTILSYDPSSNLAIGSSSCASKDQFYETLNQTKCAAAKWRNVSAPTRGLIVKQMSQQLQRYQLPLAKLISLETGKILSEGVGEVQEYIDICDYAIGLSRMINGKVIPSERADHFMMERWNPLGVVGVISAFNFPAAVYGWNSAIALICGNSVLWKGSLHTNLTSIAVSRILEKVLMDNNLPGSICSMVAGGSNIGEAMANSDDIDLLSFTGSTEVGRKVGMTVQSRFGKSILELGGNNAIVIMDDANLVLAIRAVLFAAVGTAGQRCTTARRLIVHEKIYETFMVRLVNGYHQIKIGSPFDEKVLCGPLLTKEAVNTFEKAIQTAVDQGGKVICGGQVLTKELPGNFVEPTIIEVLESMQCWKTECFVPILYVMKCSSFKDAITINNSVSHGLSSSIFTESIEQLFTWTGPEGSDCGIVNVNIPTNGAEIGGAFGGEKETGGGRESGSNSWQQYMKRQTW